MGSIPKLLQSISPRRYVPGILFRYSGLQKAIKQSSWLSIKMHKCSIKEKKPQMRTLCTCIFMKPCPQLHFPNLQLMLSPSVPALWHLTWGLIHTNLRQSSVLMWERLIGWISQSSDWLSCNLTWILAELFYSIKFSNGGFFIGVLCWILPYLWEHFPNYSNSWSSITYFDDCIDLYLYTLEIYEYLQPMCLWTSIFSIKKNETFFKVDNFDAPHWVSKGNAVLYTKGWLIILV